MPEHFEVGAEPVVSVSASYMTEIEWLAGRGYNVLGVSFPAIFNGERDRAEGGLLTVLWENLCDPILTGREQLGFSKIYCELPEPVVLRGDTHCNRQLARLQVLGYETDEHGADNTGHKPCTGSTAPG